MMTKGQKVFRAEIVTDTKYRPKFEQTYMLVVTEHEVISVGKLQTRVSCGGRYEVLNNGDWGQFAATAEEAKAKLRAQMEEQIAEAEAKVARTRAFIATAF